MKELSHVVAILAMLFLAGCANIGYRSKHLVPNDYSVQNDMNTNKDILPLGRNRPGSLQRVEKFGMGTHVVGQKLGGGPYNWYISQEDPETLDGVTLEDIYYGYADNRLEIVSFTFGKLEKTHEELVSSIKNAPNSKTGCEFASVQKGSYYISSFGVCSVDGLPVAIVVSSRNPNGRAFEQATPHQRGSAAGASEPRR